MNPTFLPQFGQMNFRAKTIARYSRDGGAITGDQKVDARQLVVKFKVYAQDDTTYQTFVNTLLGFFRPELGPFYLEDITNARRMLIALQSVPIIPVDDGTNERLADGTLNFVMLDGYWEDTTAQSSLSVTGGLTNGETMTVNNGGNFTCYPIITITALQDNPDLTFTNDTISGGFRIVSNAFLQGSQLVVDCQEGTFQLDGVDATPFLESGGFLFLIPGNNTFEYTSQHGGISVLITWRRTYAF